MFTKSCKPPVSTLFAMASSNLIGWCKFWESGAQKGAVFISLSYLDGTEVLPSTSEEELITGFFKVGQDIQINL